MSLQATVRKVKANSEQVLVVFFDMEKAYDLKWSHGNLKDINEARIDGRMFNFIQKAFKPRSFKVKVNEILTETKVQTEGIPQGNVVSPTLFILKLNITVSLNAE